MRKSGREPRAREERVRACVRARRTEEARGARGRRGGRGIETERREERRRRARGGKPSRRGWRSCTSRSTSPLKLASLDEIRRDGAPAHWSITPRTSAAGRPIASLVASARARAPPRAVRRYFVSGLSETYLPRARAGRPRSPAPPPRPFHRSTRAPPAAHRRVSSQLIGARDACATRTPASRLASANGMLLLPLPRVPSRGIAPGICPLRELHALIFFFLFVHSSIIPL